MNRTRYWIRPVLLLLVGAAPVSAQAPRQQTIDAILTAWQQRQDRFRTIQVAFEDEHVITKGAFSRRPFAPKDLKQENTGPLPPEDHKAVVAQSLVIGKGKYRYEKKAEPQWFAQERRFFTVNSTVTYDGKTRKQNRKTDGQAFRQGGVGVQSQPVEVTLTALYPLFMSFRPLDPLMQSFDVNEFSPTGATPTVGRRSCIELAKRKALEQFVLSVCLDPGREYAMTRLRIHVKNVLRSHVEIAYRQDPEYGWVPDSWHFDEYDQDGKLFGSHDERVSGYVFNAGMDDKTFDLEFDPLTFVVDTRAREQYVIREDGSKRPVGSDEFKKTFEEMLATEPAATEGRSMRTVVIVVLAGGILAASAALLAQRWRRKARGNTA